MWGYPDSANSRRGEPRFCQSSDFTSENRKASTHPSNVFWMIPKSSRYPWKHCRYYTTTRLSLISMASSVRLSQHLCMIFPLGSQANLGQSVLNWIGFHCSIHLGRACHSWGWPRWCDSFKANRLIYSGHFILKCPSYPEGGWGMARPCIFGRTVQCVINKWAIRKKGD